MAFKTGNRYQHTLLPASIEDYVGENDAVRFYDAYVDSLDLEELGFDLNEHKVGNSRYHPACMLKILLYAYSYGWRSSRKIERELIYNLSFIWLSSGLRPDARTICDFRKDNKLLFKDIMKDSVLLLKKLDLIEGTELFVDGTKVRGNSSIKNSYTEDGLDQWLSKLDEKIESLLSECDSLDAKESGDLVKMKKDLSDQKQLKCKIASSLEELRNMKKSYTCAKDNRELKNMKINITDNDAVNHKSRQGFHCGYNVQSSVDGKHGLIVNIEAESKGSDSGSLEQQVIDSSANMGTSPKVVCADSGYAQGSDMQPVYDSGKELSIPSKLQSEKEKKDKFGKVQKKFTKEAFTYDKEGDFYLCPQGHKLIKCTYRKNHEAYGYKIEDKNLCIKCPFFGECTKSKKEGRTLNRSIYEDVNEKVQEFYKSDEGQKIYKKRQHLAESPFGHIKANLNAGRLLLRGRDGANAEMSILANCYNITRTINLLGGVKNAIEAIKKISGENMAYT